MARAEPTSPDKPFFTDKQVAKMANVLKQHHGDYSAMFADFFAHEQAVIGDPVRAEAWSRVVSLLRTEGYRPPPSC